LDRRPFPLPPPPDKKKPGAGGAVQPPPPPPPPRREKVRYGTSFGVEFGMAYEVDKKGEVVRVLKLPAEPFKTEIPPPPRVGPGGRGGRQGLPPPPKADVKKDWPYRGGGAGRPSVALEGHVRHRHRLAALGLEFLVDELSLLPADGAIGGAGDQGRQRGAA